MNIDGIYEVDIDGKKAELRLSADDAKKWEGAKRLRDARLPTEDPMERAAPRTAARKPSNAARKPAAKKASTEPKA